MSRESAIIVWFRQDLRLTDNIALSEAAARECPVVPLYIHDEDTDGVRRLGGAARWWLGRSLIELDRSLRRIGSRLIFRRGPAAKVLQTLCDECNVTGIFWNRLYEPATMARDRKIKTYFEKRGLAVESHNSARLVEPWQVETKSGTPYRVFTPFWRACRQRLGTFDLCPAPLALGVPAEWPDSDDLADWRLLPTTPNWASGFEPAWQPGEAGALRRVEEFGGAAIEQYGFERDFPGIPGTSRLSPHLHFGEVGPRQVWNYANIQESPAGAGLDTFLSELGWREFCAHLLFHFPKMESDNLRQNFDDFPWRADREGLSAWQRGCTGYPIVDAGMRELWRTGWMHNRVRMIAASFLVKNLMINWRKGESWFWDTLVDADLASNVANWQWISGSGADAAPYFRIFNPVSQSRKFDPNGEYLRAYIPEIAGLPDSSIHAPWEAPTDELDRAGIILGETYPQPIVDHRQARNRALAAFDTIKGKRDG